MRFALEFGANLFCVKIIYKFFLKTHQQNLNFSLYYRGVFSYGEIKCKQGVKNFEKHPNKTGIFLRIVEGIFWTVFFFLAFIQQNILSNNLEGGFRVRNLYTVNKI